MSVWMLPGGSVARVLAALAGAVTLLTVTAAPASAALAATLSTLTLTAVPYSHQAQTTSGTATLSATDDTAANLGWNVTVQSSALAYSGTHGGTAIPAANLSITSVAAPVATSGQTIDPVGGPKVPSVSPVGALDSPRKVVQAMPTYGNGSYTQQVVLALVVPGTSAAGTYTATITTTIAIGP